MFIDQRRGTMKQDKIYYGGDYNPDQWPEEILEQDIPSLLVELGRAAAAAGQSWVQWSETHREDLNAIVAKYA